MTTPLDLARSRITTALRQRAIILDLHGLGLDTPPESGKPGSNTVYIEVKATDDASVAVREKSVFLIPR
ncbi:hypothetical protein [Zoogloea sp.]|uniref:hypothetical protein n=1 Tax=Zoogloea sp. TaxID=49181 RepID=UPI0035B11966